jgi:predicted aspartyl protease
MRFGRFLLVACALASLSACQDKPGDPAPPAACSLDRAADLPVTFNSGHVLVQGAIDQNPVSLIVDTAAQGSMVVSDTVARLRLDRDRRTSTLHGLGGEITTTNVRVTSLAVGQMEMLDQSLSVGPLPTRPGVHPPIGALLGTDFLSSFEIDLDLPHQRITLYRMANCPGNFVPWLQPGVIIPLRRLSTGFLAVEVQVDGKNLLALVDTGAVRSVITPAAAFGLGLTDEILASDPSTTDFGVDQRQILGRLHRFHDVRFGPEVLRDYRLGVANVHVTGADMLLGADVLRTLHLWLSYARQEMFLAPPGF